MVRSSYDCPITRIMQISRLLSSVSTSSVTDEELSTMLISDRILTQMTLPILGIEAFATMTGLPFMFRVILRSVVILWSIPLRQAIFYAT